MKWSTIISLIAPLAVALTVAPAVAHGHGRGGPCRQDLQALCPNVTPGPGSFRSCIETLCPSITPGPGAFGNCLQQHAGQLSAACQQHLSRMQAKMAAWRQACQGDAQTLCGDATGPRAVFKCLHQHQAELSPACQELLAQHHGHHRHHHQCGATPTPAS